MGMLPTDPSRVWPFWLERQIDPASPDFLVAEGDGVPRNRTHRSVTPVGNVASANRAFVDPRGLVTPDHGNWSIDWWIGAEDRWHVPSRSKTVRQRLVNSAPVVETAMRAPGGDVLHRAYTVHDNVLGPCVVIEIENNTSVPVAVALAVRPYTSLGLAAINSIELHGSTVTIDGTPSLVFPRPPARAVLGDSGTGDVARLIVDAPPAEAGNATPTDARVHDERGAANAVFVSPLTHTAVLRVVLPLADRRTPVRRRAIRAAGSAPAALTYPDQVAAGEQVAKGWQTQIGRGLRVELPDDNLQHAVDAALAQLLLAAGGEDLVAWPGELDLDEMRVVLGALGRFGFTLEVEQVLATWPERQSLDGAFGDPSRHDANAAALEAVAVHWQLTRDADLVDRLVGPLAKAAHWIEKRRTAKRATRSANADGLLPSGAGPVDAGPGGTYLRDSTRSARALAAIADAFEGSGQPEVAADCRTFARSLGAALDAAVAVAAADGRPIPATADRRIDAGIVANVELFAPHGSLAPDTGSATATLAAITDHFCAGPAVLEANGPRGLSPVRTAQLAMVEVERNDPVALDRLDWLVEVGGAMAGWPSVVHPRTGGGSARRPADPVATASFLTLVRQMLVRELPDGAGLAVCSVIPRTWFGQSLDVRNAPTAFGRVSYSIRWHGERPALLWEIDPHPGIDQVRLTAPGLDPSWSSTELRGEALLAVPPPPPPPAWAEPEAVADERPAGVPDLLAMPVPAAEAPVFLRPPSRPDVATVDAPEPGTGSEPGSFS